MERLLQSDVRSRTYYWMTIRKDSAGLRQISTKAEPESPSSEPKRARGIFSV